MRILYLHGFNSSGLSDKYHILKEHFNNVVSPDLPKSPKEAITFIENILVNDPQRTFIIGSSLGGFYAQYFFKKYDIPVLLINPSLTPHLSLVDKVGENVNYVTGERYEFKEKYLDELKEIYDDIKNDDEYHNVLLNIFISINDERLEYTLPEKEYPYARIIYFNDNHRFDNFEISLPDIKDMYNEYKNMNMDSITENYMSSLE